MIKGVNDTKDHDAYVSLLWSNNVHLKDYDLSKYSYPFPKKHRLLQSTNQLINITEATFRSYDIYHATYFNDFLKSYIRSKPFVTTFYDMIYERLSHKFLELSNDNVIVSRKKKIAHTADHLIAISHSTKQDMVDILGIAPEKITVIYLGSSFKPNSETLLNHIPIVNQPYILFVGNRGGYKNFIPFLQAISSLLIKYGVKLVCAGGGAFSTAEVTLIRSLYLNGLVEQIPINDVILQRLYRGAITFVFPSLYEGFGIPVLEAFSCNCPCVLSNTSSLPEVAGKAAVYIDPANVDSMRCSVENVILDDNLRKELIQEGQRQLALFSWQRTVDETLTLYKTLL
ncbi:glycosyltransferase family 1 protein [Spirosoma humi]